MHISVTGAATVNWENTIGARVSKLLGGVEPDSYRQMWLSLLLFYRVLPHEEKEKWNVAESNSSFSNDMKATESNLMQRYINELKEPIEVFTSME